MLSADVMVVRCLAAGEVHVVVVGVVPCGCSALWQGGSRLTLCTKGQQSLILENHVNPSVQAYKTRWSPLACFSV